MEQLILHLISMSLSFQEASIPEGLQFARVYCQHLLVFQANSETSLSLSMLCLDQSSPAGSREGYTVSTFNHATGEERVDLQQAWQDPDPPRVQWLRSQPKSKSPDSLLFHQQYLFEQPRSFEGTVAFLVPSSFVLASCGRIRPPMHEKWQQLNALTCLLLALLHS